MKNVPSNKVYRNNQSINQLYLQCMGNLPAVASPLTEPKRLCPKVFLVSKVLPAVFKKLMKAFICIFFFMRQAVNNYTCFASIQERKAAIFHSPTLDRFTVEKNIGLGWCAQKTRQEGKRRVCCLFQIGRAHV